MEKEKEIIDSIITSTELSGVCEKRYIYNKDGALNCYGFRKDGISETAVKIGMLFDYEKGKLASESNVDGEYPFITASDEIKTHNTYSNNGEAIIFAVSASGSLGKAHYHKGKFIASNLCLVLTSKKNSEYPINLLFYKYYFESIRKKLRKDLTDGTSKLTIDPEALMDYYIEYFDIDIQNKFVNERILPLQVAEKQFKILQNSVEQSISML